MLLLLQAQDYGLEALREFWKGSTLQWGEGVNISSSSWRTTRILPSGILSEDNIYTRAVKIYLFTCSFIRLPVPILVSLCARHYPKRTSHHILNKQYDIWEWQCLGKWQIFLPESVGYTVYVGRYEL